MSLVFLFGSSAALARRGYGIAVTGLWSSRRCSPSPSSAPGLGVAAGGGARGDRPILALEVVFLGADLAKCSTAALVPLLIAAAVGVAMTTWVRGTISSRRKAHAASMPLESG